MEYLRFFVALVPANIESFLMRFNSKHPIAELFVEKPQICTASS
jgi:hypothetical protein